MGRMIGGSIIKPILVTGSSGKVGSSFCELLDANNIKNLSVTHDEFDLAKPLMVKEYLNKCDLSGIIHCAAWTNVNLAEEKKEDCMTVNAESTKIIAEYCNEKNIPLMFISTDYVFDGTGDKPWEINDRVNPLNVYGLSKVEAEECVKKIKKHYIVRTSWVFGKTRYDFVKLIIEKSKTEKEIMVSGDQKGSPTYCEDLVPLLYKIYLSKKYGTYHAHNEGYCTRAAFARKIAEIMGSNTVIVETKTDNDNAVAKRPLNGMLSTRKLTDSGFELLPPWEDALNRFIKSR